MSGRLRGARVVNTRALHQAGDLDALLIEHAAIPLSYPCLAIAPPDDPGPLDTALADLAIGQFDWLILTSANAVAAVADWCARSGNALGGEQAFRMATVGEATAAEATAQLGVYSAFIPTGGHGEALARELPMRSGERVLMPLSEIARSEPVATLRERGAEVTTVVSYRTVTGTGGVDLPWLLRQGNVDAITFTSPSAISGCLTRLEVEGGTAADLTRIAVATIGPTTQAAATANGLGQAVMATAPSLSSLIDALNTALKRTLREGGEAWLSRSSA